jgi:hypothetical protein
LLDFLGAILVIFLRHKDSQVADGVEHVKELFFVFGGFHGEVLGKEVQVVLAVVLFVEEEHFGQLVNSYAGVGLLLAFGAFGQFFELG